MTTRLILISVLMILGPRASAQTSTGAAAISDGRESARGVTADVRTYVPTGQSGPWAQPKEAITSRKASGRPPARWVSAACLARPAWFGKVVVSWDSGSCLTGTPDANDPDAPLPSPLQLAWIAADRAMAVAERPELRIAPSEMGLTGLRSFFWLDHTPPTVFATASVPGVVVTAEARPVRFGWDFGEGPALTTSDVGRAWSRRGPGSISHLYEKRGRYMVSIEVIWEARWRIGSGPWSYLGYFSNSTGRDYPVRQLVGRLTRRDY